VRHQRLPDTNAEGPDLTGRILSKDVQARQDSVPLLLAQDFEHLSSSFRIGVIRGAFLLLVTNIVVEFGLATDARDAEE
jgi:hypothetical protein